MGSKPKLGYLGLGLMGSQMTKRLIKNGYQVTGFDPDSNKMTAAVANGVIAAASPVEVVRASDIVQACVINTTALTEAIFGEDGIVEGGGADKIFLDHSTTIANKTRELATRLREKTGMRWVDAPVSGGPPAAATGDLAVGATIRLVGVSIVAALAGLEGSVAAHLSATFRGAAITIHVISVITCFGSSV